MVDFEQIDSAREDAMFYGALSWVTLIAFIVLALFECCTEVVIAMGVLHIACLRLWAVNRRLARPW